jgi:hypothetical protein
VATTQDTEIENDETSRQPSIRRNGRSVYEAMRNSCVSSDNRENVNFEGHMEHFFDTPLNLKADLPLPEIPEYATKFSYPHTGLSNSKTFCNKAIVIMAPIPTLGASLYISTYLVSYLFYPLFAQLEN